MCVLEAQKLLLTYFGNQTTFEFAADFGKLLIVNAETKDSNVASLTAALNELEKNSVVQSAEIGSKNNIKKVWVLRKPFSSYDQSITLDLNTCIAISDIINAFREKVKNFERLSDPTNLNINDIKELGTIASLVTNEEKEETKIS